MRKIGASLVFPLSGPVIENGYLEVDERGYITSTGKICNTREMKGVDFFEGILVPGFVNAHCHLEFSYLRGRVQRERGMAHFIGEINRLRAAGEEEILRSAAEAEQAMVRQGIVAAGDISNTSVTIEIKRASRVEWFTFVETFGFSPSRAEKAIGEARHILGHFREAGLSASIVPHSPYSVSIELFREIKKLDRSECSMISLHNQESEAEKQLFHTGEGPIMEHITRNLGLDASHWKPSGKSSLETILPLLPDDIPLLLVHNTYTTQNDIRLLKLHLLKLRLLKQTASEGKQSVWMVLCPNSNLYIGKSLPPVKLFRKEKMDLCIGTDSLASNDELSVLSEIKTLHFQFPEIPLEELFTWACLNGARALGMSSRYGSFEAGKNPGILLISPADLKKRALTPSSMVQRLI